MSETALPKAMRKTSQPRAGVSKAKVFMSGGSQAVRLPAELRFDVAEVDVRRDPLTGDVILSRPRPAWDEYFEWVGTLDLPADFLVERHQPADPERDPFTTSKLRRRPSARRKA